MTNGVGRSGSTSAREGLDRRFKEIHGKYAFDRDLYLAYDQEGYSEVAAPLVRAEPGKSTVEVLADDRLGAALAEGVLFNSTQDTVVRFLPPFLMQVFEIPARWVLGIYLVLRRLVEFTQGGGEVNVIVPGINVGVFCSTPAVGVAQPGIDS